MRQLAYFARETLISLRRNLLMTVAGILTVTVSLLLLGGILLFQTWVATAPRSGRTASSSRST
jgi:cell division protein FtsX